VFVSPRPVHIGMGSSAKRIRDLSGLPRYRVAARAGVSDATARIYEIDRGSVAAAERTALDRVYCALLDELRARVADLPPWPPKVELGLCASRVRT